VFGCKVIILRDEKQRTGWKGAGHRVADGIFLGIEGESYVVLKVDTGRLVYPPYVWTLDENELALGGAPAGGVMVHATTQTDHDSVFFTPLPISEKVLSTVSGQNLRPRLESEARSDAASKPTLSDTARPQRLTMIPSRYRALEVEEPAAQKEPETKPATSIALEESRRPALRKLAGDHQGGYWAPQARLPAKRAKPTKSVSVAEVVREAMEVNHASVEVAHQLIEIAMGQEAAPKGRRGDEVCDVLQRVAGAIFDPSQSLPREALPLERKYQEVVSEAGVRKLVHVPKGYKDVMSSPLRDDWLEIDREAFEKLKATPGNYMDRITNLSSEVPIFDCVTVRKAKVFPDTQKLDKLSSRHNVDGMRGAAVLERMGLTDAEQLTSSAVADEMLVKMTIADAAGRKRTKLKADVNNAYQNARTTRGKRAMRCPPTCKEYDEDGTEMVLILGPHPLFGEPPAGREWFDTLEEDLIEFGWSQTEAVPCQWTLRTEESDAVLITVVDDLLFTESSGYAIGEATVDFLRKKYPSGVKSEREPTSFAGYMIETTPDLGTCTISMPRLIEVKMRLHCPELLEPGALDAFLKQHASGGKLEALADALRMPDPRPAKLSREAKLTQSIIGDVRYFHKVLGGRLNVLSHRLSCVMSSPPPEALLPAKIALAIAYRHREEGITYSADYDGEAFEVGLAGGFPREEYFNAAADATWGDRNIYGILVMMHGGAVVNDTKKMVLVDSSTEGEGIASSKCAEIVTVGRNILRGFGILPAGPTRIATDNVSNMRIANNIKSTARAKHALRRYHVLQQRVAEGEVKLVWVSDAANPADYLTKWVGKSKVDRSIRYATGCKARRAAFSVS